MKKQILSVNSFCYLQGTDSHLINLEQPVLLIHEIRNWNSKLGLGIWTVKDLYHQKVLVYNLESGPYFFYRFRCDEHRMLFIESFVRVHTHFVDHNQPFFPSAKNLRFLKYFSVYQAVLYYRFRYPRYIFLKRVEFQSHNLELSSDDWGKNYVMEGQFLLFSLNQLLWSCQHDLVWVVTKF